MSKQRMPEPWDVWEDGLLVGRDKWGNDVYRLYGRYFTITEVYAPELGTRAIVDEVDRHRVQLSRLVKQRIA